MYPKEEDMESVEVIVFHLEILAPLHRSVPAPREGLTVLHVPSPTVPYYRSLYDAVGKDYYGLELRAEEILAAHLHPGSSRRLAELPQGGVGPVPAGDDPPGALR